MQRINWYLDRLYYGYYRISGESYTICFCPHDHECYQAFLSINYLNWKNLHPEHKFFQNALECLQI